tara:strand:- start:216 stop:329 length:114 start_codon:yes stop_codon:yes gene_type:complete
VTEPFSGFSIVTTAFSGFSMSRPVGGAGRDPKKPHKK